MLRFRVHDYVWRTILVALTLLVLARLSDAQLDQATVENCGSLNTQSEMNDCAAREAHKADDALNSTYQEVLGKLKSDKTLRPEWSRRRRRGSPSAMQNSRPIGRSRMERIRICCTGLCIRFVTITHALY